MTYPTLFSYISNRAKRVRYKSSPIIAGEGADRCIAAFDEATEHVPERITPGSNGVVEVVQSDGATRIVMTDELDMHTARGAGFLLESVCDARPSRVVVDLSRLEFVDSHGLQLLVVHDVAVVLDPQLHLFRRVEHDAHVRILTLRDGATSRRSTAPSREGAVDGMAG